LVKVEPAGRCIRIGIKNAAGTPISWIEPGYPFLAPPPGLQGAPIDGWEYRIEVPTPQEMRVIFTRSGEQHVLTVLVTNPGAHPKPVTVSWM
jgi:hypothetical protein